jgi:hypothetical protein
VLGWWGEKARNRRPGFGSTLAPEHLAGEDGLPRVWGDATQRMLTAGLWSPGAEAATPHQRRSPSIVVRRLPVLMGLVNPLYPPLGLRRTGRDQRSEQYNLEAGS